MEAPRMRTASLDLQPYQPDCVHPVITRERGEFVQVQDLGSLRSRAARYRSYRAGRRTQVKLEALRRPGEARIQYSILPQRTGPLTT
jgi:hypothetical protein